MVTVLQSGGGGEWRQLFVFAFEWSDRCGNAPVVSGMTTETSDSYSDGTAVETVSYLVLW